MSKAIEEQGWQEQWLQVARNLVRVDAGSSESELIEALARPARPTVLAFVNAHAMNSIAASRAFYEAIRSADLVLRDGSGMALLLKLLELPPGLNMNGTDLIPRIIRRYAGQPIALFGTQAPWLEHAREHVAATLAPGSTCTIAHGFLPTSDYLRLAAEAAPRLIVLGMGMPRQEEVARELRASLAHPCLIVCGGAIIDFMGGKTPRAPAWMRALGIEWLYRLGLEPKRLFRRYVLGNPLFVARALRLAAFTARPGRSKMSS
jgi:N-acetylglucosaminyldiphosphoundecaprenol N-acetyl-beta-D-mannosaminyltransferase